jgi:HEPN domain-containing protein
MLSFSDLRKMARARVEDAKALYAAGRYDGAVYIAGYAVECQLKARIATGLLAQGEWPESNSEFESFSRMKSHKLEDLLRLSGREARLSAPKYQAAWSYILRNWKPESRYAKIGTVNAQAAENMIAAVAMLLRAL